MATAQNDTLNDENPNSTDLPDGVSTGYEPKGYSWALGKGELNGAFDERAPG